MEGNRKLRGSYVSSKAPEAKARWSVGPWRSIHHFVLLSCPATALVNSLWLLGKSRIAWVISLHVLADRVKGASDNLPSDLQMQIWRDGGVVQVEEKTLNPTVCGHLALIFFFRL